MKSVLRNFLSALMAFFFSAGCAMAQQQVTLQGLIEPSEVVKVGSPVNGILERVLVERGDRVTKGQIIASLKSDLEQAAVDLAMARMQFSERKVLRNQGLQQKQLISVHEKDEIETELRISRLQLHEAEERLALRTIHSTIEGVVVERFLSPGEYVGEGEEPIVKIACIDPLYVEVVASAEAFGTIKTDMLAKVIPEFRKTSHYSARVIIVDRVIDAASGTFGVRLELSNADYLLPAGLKCHVVFPIK